ncbi:hypothetical protein QZH41_015297 [Actinostola sp. cb2023]|nr:hypothetical protein QZH41_015297 [Actinostola sp. cb2023]
MGQSSSKPVENALPTVSATNRVGRDAQTRCCNMACCGDRIVSRGLSRRQWRGEATRAESYGWDDEDGRKVERYRFSAVVLTSPSSMLKVHKDEEARLASQTTHQIHRPSRKRYPRRPFVVHSLDEMWQLDLTDMKWYKRQNNGYAWILFAIDVSPGTRRCDGAPPRSPETVCKTVNGAWEAERATDAKFAFEVGDTVRISRQSTLFRKGYLSRWSEEWFRVHARDRGPPPYYRLEDLQDEAVEGWFYEQELQKVTPEEQKTATFRIEKVIKRHTREGREEVFVRWLGWPAKFNEWLPAARLENLS